MSELQGIQSLIYNAVNEKDWLGTGGTHTVFKISDPNFEGIAVRIPNRMLMKGAEHAINLQAPYDEPSQKLTRALLNSSCLTPVNEMYVGEGIGQTLMELKGRDDGSWMYEEKLSDQDIDTDISFVKQEQGDNLTQTYERPASALRARTRENLKPHYQALQEQVARLGYHAAEKGHLVDSHMHNILYSSDGLHMVDAFHPIEDFTEAKENAKDSSERLIQDVLEFLDYDIAGAEKTSLKDLLEGNHETIAQQIDDESLPLLKQTGFTNVHDVSAVAVTAPAHQLRVELDKLQQKIADGITRS